MVGGGEVYVAQRSVVRVRWVGQVEQPLCAMQQQPWVNDQTTDGGWVGWVGVGSSDGYIVEPWRPLLLLDLGLWAEGRGCAAPYLEVLLVAQDATCRQREQNLKGRLVLLLR